MSLFVRVVTHYGQMSQMTRMGFSVWKGSDQSGEPAPRSALAWTGRCLRVDVPPWKTKKLHFWNSIRAIWYIPFGNILLKKSFKVNYWIHYHVWRSSNFSCFDAFVRTFINLWKFKSGCLRGSSLSEASEGEFPLQNWKKIAIFKLN